MGSIVYKNTTHAHKNRENNLTRWGTERQNVVSCLFISNSVWVLKKLVEKKECRK